MMVGGWRKMSRSICGSTRLAPCLCSLSLIAGPFANSEAACPARPGWGGATGRDQDSGGQLTAGRVASEREKSKIGGYILRRIGSHRLLFRVCEPENVTMEAWVFKPRETTRQLAVVMKSGFASAAPGTVCSFVG